jgi:hypothetical protein
MAVGELLENGGHSHSIKANAKQAPIATTTPMGTCNPSRSTILLDPEVPSFEVTAPVKPMMPSLFEEVDVVYAKTLEPLAVSRPDDVVVRFRPVALKVDMLILGQDVDVDVLLVLFVQVVVESVGDVALIMVTVT